MPSDLLYDVRKIILSLLIWRIHISRFTRRT
nr:MAG TPA: hypothetical protein [Bacteriophage sp.]